MNYKKAEQLIGDIEKKGSIYGLECMEELVKRLGNPQKELKFIHVAGTNGKGSVIAFLSKILSEAGYLIGRFTSPAVFSRRETISTNYEDITEEEYADIINQVITVSDSMKNDGLRQPTAFEIETAAAFMYFKLKKCDIVLLEVGLGGDLDATNIIDAPLCSVIMPISVDHVNLLGDSIEEIALHKAGIIKAGSCVVSARQTDSVGKVLKKVADDKGVPLIYPKECIRKNCVFLENNSDIYQQFNYNGDNGYEVALLGRCQIDNASVALEVIDVLRDKGYTISDKAVKDGLKYTRWKGRFTLIHHKPDIIIDGAHNIAAALALTDSLKEYISNNNFNKVIMIAGMLSDKDYESVIKTVGSCCDKLITISTDVYNRQLSSKILEETAIESGIEAQSADTVLTAVNMTFKEIQQDDLLVVFGSFSFLAEFENVLNAVIDK